MNAVINKYNDVVERLVRKINLSQTPVPGFIIGLSGTDSILSFAIAHEACMRAGLAPPRLLGIHYVNSERKRPTWFEKEIIPWMKEKWPAADILVETPLGGNQDQQRWADIHLRALNIIQYDGAGDRIIRARDPGENYWTLGSINATEKFLGNYSMMANCVSVHPILAVYKNMVLKICEAIGVPDIAIEMSKTPDCLCGRDELAANNIDIIDEIITFKIDPTQYDPDLLARLYQYVKEKKASNDFKMRVPFLV